MNGIGFLWLLWKEIKRFLKVFGYLSLVEYF